MTAPSTGSITSWFTSRRLARWIALLSVLVFGFVVPAHLGGADRHHHAHLPHAHPLASATAAPSAARVDRSQCVTCEILDSHHEHDHVGHDHRLSLPRKVGSGPFKSMATASEAAFGMTPRCLARAPIVEARLPQRSRIDRAPPQPRGPPRAHAPTV